jgi:hypothetical protein
VWKKWWKKIKPMTKKPVFWIVGVIILLLLAFAFMPRYMNLSADPSRDQYLGVSPGAVPTELYKTASEPETLTPSKPAPAPVQKVPAKLIKTATLKIQVKDYKKSLAAIETLVKANNGYIANSEEHHYGSSIENALIIRIPATQFETLYRALQKEAFFIDEKNSNIKDVTAEFIDTEARLKAKRALEARYLQILRQARNVKEILEVEAELGNIREEIESAEGLLKYMSDQIAFSTINLTIYQPIAGLPRGEAGFWHKLLSAVIDGWNGLLGFFIWLIGLWPLLAIIGGGWYFIRWWQGRKAQAKKAKADAKQAVKKTAKAKTETPPKV